MKAEIKDKFSPLEKFTIGVIEEKFEALAHNCRHQLLDSQGDPNCAYHSPAVSFCRPEFCPRLKSKESERDDVNEVRRRDSKSRK